MNEYSFKSEDAIEFLNSNKIIELRVGNLKHELPMSVY